jgi:hypothetical protein
LCCKLQLAARATAVMQSRLHVPKLLLSNAPQHAAGFEADNVPATAVFNLVACCRSHMSPPRQQTAQHRTTTRASAVFGPLCCRAMASLHRSSSSSSRSTCRMSSSSTLTHQAQPTKRQRHQLPAQAQVLSKQLQLQVTSCYMMCCICFNRSSAEAASCVRLSCAADCRKPQCPCYNTHHHMLHGLHGLAN